MFSRFVTSYPNLPYIYALFSLIKFNTLGQLSIFSPPRIFLRLYLLNSLNNVVHVESRSPRSFEALSETICCIFSLSAFLCTNIRLKAMKN